MPKKQQFPAELFVLMDEYDVSGLSEWAAVRRLSEAVDFFNVKNGTNFDTKKAIDAYFLDRNFI